MAKLLFTATTILGVIFTWTVLDIRDRNIAYVEFMKAELAASSEEASEANLVLNRLDEKLLKPYLPYCKGAE